MNDLEVDIGLVIDAIQFGLDESCDQLELLKQLGLAVFKFGVSMLVRASVDRHLYEIRVLLPFLLDVKKFNVFGQIIEHVLILDWDTILQVLLVRGVKDTDAGEAVPEELLGLLVDVWRIQDILKALFEVVYGEILVFNLSDADADGVLQEGDLFEAVGEVGQILDQCLAARCSN